MGSFFLPSQQGDTLLSSAQTQVWYCSHCTFCNSGPGWVCAVCNRTSDHIPVQHTPRPHARSLDGELHEPGPPRRLSAPLPSSSGDSDKQRQDKMREEGHQLVMKIRVRMGSEVRWDCLEKGEVAID